jgi:hypothetical protein
MTKTKETQTKVTSRAKHKLHTEISKKAPLEQMQAPPEHLDANFQILDAFFLNFSLSSLHLFSPLLEMYESR